MLPSVTFVRCRCCCWVSVESSSACLSLSIYYTRMLSGSRTNDFDFDFCFVPRPLIENYNHFSRTIQSEFPRDRLWCVCACVCVWSLLLHCSVNAQQRLLGAGTMTESEPVPRGSYQPLKGALRSVDKVCGQLFADYVWLLWPEIKANKNREKNNRNIRKITVKDTGTQSLEACE